MSLTCLFENPGIICAFERESYQLNAARMNWSVPGYPVGKRAHWKNREMLRYGRIILEPIFSDTIQEMMLQR